MRLSEIKGDRVFDVIAEIIDPACNIMQDEDASSLFNREEGESVMDAVRRSVPALMRTHKQDLITILSAVQGVSPDEYVRDLTLPKLVQEVYEIMTDEDLLAFLS